MIFNEHVIFRDVMSVAQPTATVCLASTSLDTNKYKNMSVS